MKKIITLISLVLILASCNDFLDPRMSNELTQEQLLTQPGSIANLAFTAYGSFSKRPDDWSNSFLDCATDNALDSDVNSKTSKMLSVAGNWTSRSSILDNWNSSYDKIRHINLFLDTGLEEDVVYFKSDPEKDELYKARLKGEAYFLRAYIQFDLLRRFSGVDVNGKLLGFPIMTEVMGVENLKQLPRNSFDECVNQIISDIEVSLQGGLKDQWENTDVYNEIVGTEAYGRANNLAAMALKSRVLLYAASPSYTIGLSATQITERYQKAAQAAYQVIQKIGTTLPDVYSGDISTNFYNAPQNDELILRALDGNNGSTDGMAVRNFPPATLLLGQGNCNPSQNLVDAFPMANGYPISHATNNMGYTDDNMYVNRDPRFYNTILYNGSTFKGVDIQLYPGGNCAIGAENVNDNETSRTGYYLRKWLSPTANLVAGNKVKDFHYFPLFRKVEAFLNFAEASNMAYGPQGVDLGMSAQEAIREVRRRAGINGGGTDGYLNEIASDQIAMTELIKNERRLELCFEGHRFFDLRRWQDNMNTTVKGVQVTNNAGVISLTRINVVTPIYEAYMHYGPIPNGELLKTDMLTQNQGW